jgi:hypothetical protein
MHSESRQVRGLRREEEEEEEERKKFLIDAKGILYACENGRKESR